MPSASPASLGQVKQSGPQLERTPHSQPLRSSRRVLRLDDLIPEWPHHEILNIGVLPQMLVDLSEDYGLTSLCKSRHCFPLLKPAAAHTISSLPLGDDSATPDAFQIIVDGSYHADSEASAWALCILGLVNTEWQWFGFLSDALPPQLASGPSGKASAHVAEQWALLHAVAFAVSHVHTYIHRLRLHFCSWPGGGPLQQSTTFAFAVRLHQLAARLSHSAGSSIFASYPFPSRPRRQRVCGKAAATTTCCRSPLSINFSLSYGTRVTLNGFGALFPPEAPCRLSQSMGDLRRLQPPHRLLAPPHWISCHHPANHVQLRHFDSGMQDSVHITLSVYVH